MQVWIGIVFSLLISALVLWIVRRIEVASSVPKETNNTGFSYQVWYLFRVLTNGESMKKLFQKISSLNSHFYISIRHNHFMKIL